MIRYHLTNGTSPTYLVTTRRRPRGYVYQSCDHRREVLVVNRYIAETKDYVIEGWRPQGFNGVVGPIYGTKRQAADALISQHKYHLGDNNVVSK